MLPAKADNIPATSTEPATPPTHNGYGRAEAQKHLAVLSVKTYALEQAALTAKADVWHIPVLGVGG